MDYAASVQWLGTMREDGAHNASKFGVELAGAVAAQPGGRRLLRCLQPKTGALQWLLTFAGEQPLQAFFDDSHDLWFSHFSQLTSSESPTTLRTLLSSYRQPLRKARVLLQFLFPLRQSASLEHLADQLIPAVQEAQRYAGFIGAEVLLNVQDNSLQLLLFWHDSQGCQRYTADKPAIITRAIEQLAAVMYKPQAFVVLGVSGGTQ